MRSQSQSCRSVSAILARYVSLVEDPNALQAIANTLLPVGFWVNPLKSHGASLVDYLQAVGIEVEPIEWMPGAWRAREWRSPGQTLAFTAGWYYVQEEIAMAAVPVLDPQPGEQILDMCAAPGGKTAQIALRLQNTGLVIANELHAARMPSLSTTIARLGLTNVITTQGDGRVLPLPPHQFDRVLVDVPCSGEGNLRRRQHPRPWQPQHGLRIAAAQKKLLSRALDLVKPGGVVVYSTCTFAPEENEAVLDAVLGDRAYLEPIHLPGLQGQAGVTQWQGQSYRQDMPLAQRYFPHFNNTGGFFMAKLRRTDAACLASTEPLEHPTLASVSIDPVAPIQKLQKDFGLPDTEFQPYACWATGKKRLWLTQKHCRPIAGLQPQTLGIPVVSYTNLGFKPTTAFLQHWGAQIQRNVVELRHEQDALAFVQGETQTLDTNLVSEMEPGYIHVRYGAFQLGCGRQIEGKLQSQLPKTLRWAAKR
ncbi:MAG: NOL1/NOP2/sun family putative RNA methylase [Cyanobacteria bacterium J06638_28]